MRHLLRAGRVRNGNRLVIKRFKPSLKLSNIRCLLVGFLLPILPFRPHEIGEEARARFPEICRDRFLKVDAVSDGGQEPQLVI